VREQWHQLVVLIYLPISCCSLLIGEALAMYRIWRVAHLGFLEGLGFWDCGSGVRGGAVLALWSVWCKRIVFSVPLKTSRISLQVLFCCNCEVVFGGEFGRSWIRQGKLATRVEVVFDILVWALSKARNHVHNKGECHHQSTRMLVIQFRHMQWIIDVGHPSPITIVGNVDGAEKIVSLTVLQS
jgi:hypothetical protein